MILLLVTDLVKATSHMYDECMTNGPSKNGSNIIRQMLYVIWQIVNIHKCDGRKDFKMIMALPFNIQILHLFTHLFKDYSYFLYQ